MNWFRRLTSFLFRSSSRKKQALGKQIRPQGRLEAVHVRESAVAVRRSGEHVTGVRMQDDHETSLASDLMKDGSATLLLSGRSRQGEQGVGRVCTVLVACLNADGAKWSAPRILTHSHARDEIGLDADTRDGWETIGIQVVRAEHKPTLWRALSQIGHIQARFHPDEVAHTLRSAIEKKAARTTPVQRQGLILALDALDTPSHCFEPAVATFRTTHGQWSRALGYRSIWVVGPNVSLTSRLDSTGHAA